MKNLKLKKVKKKPYLITWYKSIFDYNANLTKIGILTKILSLKANIEY